MRYGCLVLHYHIVGTSSQPTFCSMPTVGDVHVWVQIFMDFVYEKITKFYIHLLLQ